ncbi:hypothetical protein EDB81DRAFT_849113 [Dactylonectria macrodidyma]|uniref:NmrA-like domain-containing protein n=1 Tax=Dactylonectria macrodidyma TaxID=307937 RepID=A0A9P9D135_9HYPO|nr:hypothetical protein EDB81DRAFT_849113 [Dactylonectria macrodidyma]
MVFTVGIAGITGKFARLIAKRLPDKPDGLICGYCGCDVVVCCYPGDDTHMTQGQKLLIDACEEQGLVKEHPDVKSKIQGVHALIGTFMDTFWNPWSQILRPEERTLRYWGTGDEIWESTPYTNAADFVAEVVMDQQATGMQKFLGDRKSIRQIADAFQDAYNERPQLECLGSLDELYKIMHAKREEDLQNKAPYIPLQTHLGVDMNTLPYPGLKRVTFNDFLRTHGIDYLAGAAKALA